ncbi:MAG TPA: M56 family metallopeptidase [Steroidobacteraceae bacterium]|jgi:TonB family protein|nr:M56 family metallopeptidase [Steroidobacteraceae bacterium]
MMPLLIEAALRSTALLLAAWLTLKALRIHDAHAEKQLWSAVVLVSLLMPLLMRTLALQLPAPQSVTISGSVAAARALRHFGHPVVDAVGVRSYWVVTGFLLLRFLVRLLRASAIYRRARKPAAPILPGIAVRMSDEIAAPCTFAGGILLPAEFDSWDPSTRAAALAHERAHVVHRDGYRLWLATVLTCVFWFNPLSWLLRRRLTLLAELTSDEAGLRCVADSTAYARILLQVAAGAPPMDTAVAMSGGTQLSERIKRIVEDNMTSCRLGIMRKIALAATSLIAAALCSCASGPHVLSQTEDPKVTWVSGASLSQFYPAQLQKQHVEGDVVLKLVVDSTGRVTDVKAVREHPAGSGLARASVRAARTFRFNNTLAEPVIKTMQLKFALSD